MKKYKIFYMDDQSFALPQVIGSIPKGVSYEFEYVQYVRDIPVAGKLDLVLLDFYLDKDAITALELIHYFKNSLVVSFSTCDDKNKLMLSNGALYGVQKLKNTNTNKELEKVLKNIFFKR